MAENRVDRRMVLKLAAMAVAFVGANGTGAEARPKATKAQARYQESPKDGQRCGGCKFFIYPSGCSVVKGEVAFNGWCKLYER